MKSTAKKVLRWGRIEKNPALIVALVLVVASTSSVKFRGEKYRISQGKGLTTEVVPFAYVSKIGGMVGGFTATSNSQYINSSGLVQVSKEETNGVLHMLKIGHADTRAFFDDLARDCKLLLPKRKSAERDQAHELSEYYPPKTLVCYSVPSQGNVICNSYGINETTDALKNFVNKAEKIIIQSALALAEAGLYARAQRIPEADLNFITPDVKLEHSDIAANKRLVSILKNEMALIRIGEEAATVVLANKITLLPDKPIYIQIGKRVYLLITYRYKG